MGGDARPPHWLYRLCRTFPAHLISHPHTPTPTERGKYPEPFMSSPIESSDRAATAAGKRRVSEKGPAGGERRQHNTRKTPRTVHASDGEAKVRRNQTKIRIVTCTSLCWLVAFIASQWAEPNLLPIRWVESRACAQGNEPEAQHYTRFAQRLKEHCTAFEIGREQAETMNASLAEAAEPMRVAHDILGGTRVHWEEPSRSSGFELSGDAAIVNATSEPPWTPQANQHARVHRYACTHAPLARHIGRPRLRRPRCQRLKRRRPHRSFNSTLGYPGEGPATLVSWNAQGLCDKQKFMELLRQLRRVGADAALRPGRVKTLYDI